MRITTNNIGNYGINRVHVPRETSVNKAPDEGLATLNNNEKDFFMKKYPANKSDIVDYHFYSRGGGMNGVTKGNLLDRRG